MTTCDIAINQVVGKAHPLPEGSWIVEIEATDFTPSLGAKLTAGQGNCEVTTDNDPGPYVITLRAGTASTTYSTTGDPTVRLRTEEGDTGPRRIRSVLYIDDSQQAEVCDTGIAAATEIDMEVDGGADGFTLVSADVSLTDIDSAACDPILDCA